MTSTISRLINAPSLTGTSTGVLPEPKAPPSVLVVMWAFDKNDEGDMVPAFDPREMPDERRAIAAAKLAAATHAAAIAWKRAVRPDRGEFGEPEILFQHGPVPDLD
jgi:hypothetical protein